MTISHLVLIVVLAHQAACLSLTLCSSFLNNMCADLNDADVRLYLSDQTGPYYEMNVRLKSVWLSNPIRPVVRRWRNCVEIPSTESGDVFNETIVNCDAVGFQGTTLTYTVRAFHDNSSVDDAHNPFYIKPGAFEILYNLQYTQACLSADYNCTTERVNVSRPHLAAHAHFPAVVPVSSADAEIVDVFWKLLPPC